MQPNNRTNPRTAPNEPGKRDTETRKPLEDEPVVGESQRGKITGRDWDAEEAVDETDATMTPERAAAPRPDPVLEDPTEDRE